MKFMAVVPVLIVEPIVNMQAEGAEQECTLEGVVGEDMETDGGINIGAMKGAGVGLAAGQKVLVDFNRAKIMDATKILLGEEYIL